MSQNILYDKSKAFAVRIVRLYKLLCDDRKEYVLSKQLLRSGTSIGANIAEAINAMSTKEFIAKLNISLKETAESIYWLEILKETDYLTETEYESINTDCIELRKLLTSIIKTSNSKSQIQ